MNVVYNAKNGGRWIYIYKTFGTHTILAPYFVFVPKSCAVVGWESEERKVNL